jgi:hypothetical protein
MSNIFKVQVLLRWNSCRAGAWERFTLENILILQNLFFTEVNILVELACRLKRML